MRQDCFFIFESSSQLPQLKVWLGIFNYQCVTCEGMDQSGRWEIKLRDRSGRFVATIMTACHVSRDIVMATATQHAYRILGQLMQDAIASAWREAWKMGHDSGLQNQSIDAEHSDWITSQTKQKLQNGFACAREIKIPDSVG